MFPDAEALVDCLYRGKYIINYQFPVKTIIIQINNFKLKFIIYILHPRFFVLNLNKTSSLKILFYLSKKKPIALKSFVLKTNSRRIKVMVLNFILKI